MPTVISGDTGVSQVQNGSIVSADFAPNAIEGAMTSAFSFRNKIINGAMEIVQRGTTAATNVAGTAYYCVDRWAGATFASGAAVTLGQGNDGSVSQNSKFHLYHQTATIKASLAAGDYSHMFQRIEGYNTADLLWGSASAKTITLRFRARVDNVGASATISVAIRNGGSGSYRSYVTPVTITSTTATYSVTIPGDTTGTWATDNNIGIDVSFCSASGATYQTSTVNTWQTGNFIAANTQTNMLGTLNAALNISDVQLEVGAIATPFEHRFIGTEELLCKRYTVVVPYTDIYMAGYAGAASTTVGQSVGFMVPMRNVPSVSSTLVYSYAGSVSTGGVSAFGNNGYRVHASSGGQYIMTATSGSAIFSAEL